MEAKNTKKAMSFIFITLLIDVMGWGLIIPVMADLIAQICMQDEKLYKAQPFIDLMNIF